MDYGHCRAGMLHYERGTRASGAVIHHALGCRSSQSTVHCGAIAHPARGTLAATGGMAGHPAAGHYSLSGRLPRACATTWGAPTAAEPDEPLGREATTDITGRAPLVIQRHLPAEARSAPGRAQCGSPG